jgi:1-acyl-sn-glycerol-3-phosphate acyltransferase
MMNPLYRIARAVIGLLLRLLTRLEISGIENVPCEGPFIMAMNHLHWLDPPLAMVVIPRQMAVFAAEKWEHRWPVGWLLKNVGNAIFVRRGEVDRKALRAALSLLESGKVLGLAPEGTRSRTGGLQRGKDGAAYLAMRTGVPIVPLAAWGQETTFRELKRGRRARIRVVIGSPFRLTGIARDSRAEELAAATERIMRTIAEMLPEEYRGVYR